MREHICNGHKVLFFNSPEVLPMNRYQKFNKHLMIDNDVGSDFADYNARTDKSIKFFKRGMNKEGLQELENRRQTVYNAFTMYSPKHHALATLVHSIDGKERGYLDDDLEKTIDILDKIGFSHKDADDTIEAVKKKSKKNYVRTFLKNLKARIVSNTIASY